MIFDTICHIWGVGGCASSVILGPGHNGRHAAGYQPTNSCSPNFPSLLESSSYGSKQDSSLSHCRDLWNKSAKYNSGCQDITLQEEHGGNAEYSGCGQSASCLCETGSRSVSMEAYHTSPEGYSSFIHK